MVLSAFADLAISTCYQMEWTCARSIVFFCCMSLARPFSVFANMFVSSNICICTNQSALPIHKNHHLTYHDTVIYLIIRNYINIINTAFFWHFAAPSGPDGFFAPCLEMWKRQRSCHTKTGGKMWHKGHNDATEKWCSKWAERSLAWFCSGVWIV